MIFIKYNNFYNYNVRKVLYRYEVWKKKCIVPLDGAVTPQVHLASYSLTVYLLGFDVLYCIEHKILHLNINIRIFILV